jgi:signal recognition particle GTPase
VFARYDLAYLVGTTGVDQVASQRVLEALRAYLYLRDESAGAYHGQALRFTILQALQRRLILMRDSHAIKNLILICGPNGVGKSTACRQRQMPRSCVGLSMWKG